jgi:hypothetical protein
MRFSVILPVLSALFAFAHASALEQPPQAMPQEAAGLEQFAPFIGKTFVTVSDDPDAVRDVQVWETVLGGKAVRITHSLNDGEYGGESLIYVDVATGDLTYVYVTTAGFRTDGMIRFHEDGSWSAEEIVEGHETIAKVVSSGRMEGDNLVSSSTYINKDGTTTPGHGFTYVISEDAKLVW